MSKDSLAPFVFHGLSFTRNSSDEAVSDCPFCTKEGHFHVSPTTGQYHCKRCGASGNQYSYLAHVLDSALGDTSPTHWKKLSKLRKDIPWQAYREAKVAYTGDKLDGSPGDWLLPVYNPDGKLANLYRWNETSKTLYATSGCNLHLLQGERLKNPDITTVYVAEGHWDTIALTWLLSQLPAKEQKHICVVGTPGANVFKKEWAEQLTGKEVILLYDNDAAGNDGMVRTAKMLKGKAKSVSKLAWPSSTPDGYDLNDMISDRMIAKLKPPTIWKELSGSAISTAPQVESDDDSSQKEGKQALAKYDENRLGKYLHKSLTFDQVCKEFKKYVHTDSNTENALATVFATVLSTSLPGDPLWMFMVGPPGSGKTMTLMSLDGSPDTEFQSSLTPHSLVSGFRTEDGVDPSLLEHIPGKTLIVKDYTTLMAMPTAVQDEIFGVLRDAYDGKVTKRFGNGLERVYDDCHFSIIAGVTDAIHGHDRASLGERFLKFEFIRTGHDPEKHIAAALRGMDNMVLREQTIRQVAQGFLHHKLKNFNPKKIPKVPKWVTDRIIGLSQVIAYVRATVERGFYGNLVFRPRPEIGTRLAKQLVKLGKCLAMVFGKNAIDERCYKIMEQVAFDTAVGWHLDVIRVLVRNWAKASAANPSAGLVSPREIELEAKIGYRSLQVKLDNLLELGIVEKARIEKPKPGQPAFGYRMTDKVMQLWQRADVTLEVPKSSATRKPPRSSSRKRRGK